ncbi:hypothetical protein [Streptomyces sp. NPDC048191]|uniref:hypothetical protein n=1 Tax=Streptomyces sp. NPDC048191 TaxID=3155484 RepID=UPI0033FCE492
MPSTPGRPRPLPPAHAAVVTLISTARFAPYLAACGGDTAAALSLYRWNGEAAAAFFEPLGHLEIMLRNAMDARLVHRQQRRQRTTEWYDDPTVPLSDKARADIRTARQRAQRGGAVTPRGKIIAELGFGFWRFLLARQYRATLWPDLAGAFPHAPSRALTLVEDPVQRLHKLRNRIAHRRGIWTMPLAARHDDLRTVISYIDPAASAWVAASSRVADVLARRP